MEINPPRLAAALLWLAPRDYREFLAGDLYEEFVRHGRSQRWYWRQVARSVPQFLAMRARNADWEQAAAAFLVTAAWLALGWHGLWRFVLSSIPLKADPIRWWF